MMHVIAIDTETTLLPPRTKVRSEFHVPELVCTSIAEDGDPPIVVSQLEAKEEQLEKELKFFFGDDENLVVFHNAQFDLMVLAKAYPDVVPHMKRALAKGRIRDTRIMYSFRWPDNPGQKTLAAACRRVLGVELEKGAVRVSYRPGIPLTEEQIEYAKQDAEVTLRLYRALARLPYGGLSERPKFFNLHQVGAELTGAIDPDATFSCAAGWMAFQLEPVGLEVDLPTLQDYYAQHQNKLDGHFRELVSAGLARYTRDTAQPVTRERHDGSEWASSVPRRWTFEPESGRMVRRVGEYLEWGDPKVALKQKTLRSRVEEDAARIGLAPEQIPVSEKTGETSLEYDFWKQYKEVLSPDIQTYLDMAKARKLQSTYFVPLTQAVRKDGRLIVHPNIGVAFAETGRWTCSRPNLQNQPKSIRDMYKSPRPGHVLLTADYKSLEMYTACEAMHRLGIRGPLREVLDKGGDTHANTAELMFGESDDKKRKVAKICNFALLGGMGPAKFLKQARAAGLEWTLDFAREMRWRWFDAFTDCRCFLEMFKVNPWDLCPPEWLRSNWLEANGIDSFPWPSSFELSKQLNGGALYEVRLPSGRVIPNRHYSQAANLFFQGIGAEVVTEAFSRCCAAGLEVCVVVHDSITITAAPEDEALCSSALENCMRSAQADILSCGVHIPVPEVEIGERWS